MKPEEMSVIAIIPVVIVVKYHRTNIEPAYYMSIIWMVIVVFVIPVRIRIISAVIIAPAIVVPTVMFPSSVPVFLSIVIIMPVIFFI